LILVRKRGRSKRVGNRGKAKGKAGSNEVL
jgi:hypothetical protein